MEWDCGTVHVAGHDLEYACWGPAPDEAPTLVMLHEGLGSVGLWRDWPAKLAAATGMGVLAYSRAGYGRSSPVSLPRPLDYMTHEAVDVLGPLMDAAGLEHVVLLGHSDGATIAGIYAGSVSDMRVRGLILIAPHYFAEAMGVEAIVKTGAAYREGTFAAKLAKHHDHPDVAFFGWHDAWTAPGFADWNVADCIDHWRIPALVIQGDADPYGSFKQVNECMERTYSPCETLLLDGVGHAPHTEAEAEVTEAVQSFCETLWRLEASASQTKNAL